MKVKIPDIAPLNQQTFNDNGDRWFVSRLIEKVKDLPVQEMPMSGLNIYNLAPECKTMLSFVAHVKKVMDADLSYPIILDADGYVMDGRHRIAKAILNGCESIKFVRFDETPPPDYVVEEDK